MKFSCDRCHKRFSTADAPVPGRVYRVPCRCGNTIVLQLDAAAVPVGPGAASAAPRPPRRRTEPPPLPARAAGPRAAPPPAVPAVAALPPEALAADVRTAPALPWNADLRALLAHSAEPVTPTVVVPRTARRDPDAAAEVTAPHDAGGALDPFAEAIRRMRTHALVAGGAAGAVVGAICATAIAALVLRPSSPAVARPAEGPPPVIEVAPALDPEPARPEPTALAVLESSPRQATRLRPPRPARPAVAAVAPSLEATLPVAYAAPEARAREPAVALAARAVPAAELAPEAVAPSPEARPPVGEGAADPAAAPLPDGGLEPAADAAAPSLAEPSAAEPAGEPGAPETAASEAADPPFAGDGAVPGTRLAGPGP